MAAMIALLRENRAFLRALIGSIDMVDHFSFASAAEEKSRSRTDKRSGRNVIRAAAAAAKGKYTTSQAAAACISSKREWVEAKGAFFLIAKI